MNLSSEDKLLLRVLKLKMNAEEAHQFDMMLNSPVDWDKIVLNTIKNGVGALLYKKIDTDNYRPLVPVKAYDELKKIYYKNYGRNVVFYSQFREAVELFKKENIDIIPLKGIFLAETVYKDLGLRQLSDVDLLVRTSEDAERCRSLMNKSGFSSENVFPSDFIKEHEKHLAPLVKNGVAFELHTLIHRKNTPYDVHIDDFWNNSKKCVLNGVEVLTLSPNDLLLHIIIHFLNHIEANLLQLKMLADILNILEFYKADINWTEFEVKCKLYNCYNEVRKILFLLKPHYAISCPLHLGAEECSDPIITNAFINMLTYNVDSLTGERIRFNLSRNIINLKREKGFRNKLRHLWGDIFPARSFMIRNYRIKYNWTVYGYYIVRIFIGIYKLIMYMFIRRKS